MQIQNLRVYERRGLVDPDRTAGGSRLYSPADIEPAGSGSATCSAQGLNLAGIAEVLRLEADNDRLREQVRRLRARG